MIIIKFKKSFLFSTSLVIISLAIFTCPVLGSVVYRPIDYFVYKGTHISGDLDSLKYNDGDIFQVNGKLYMGLQWQLGIYVDFDHRYYVGEGNGVGMKVKFSGSGWLIITIKYYEGGATVYDDVIDDTGGDWLTITFGSADYKSVEWVEFWTSQFSKQYLYIDYVMVAYGQFW